MWQVSVAWQQQMQKFTTGLHVDVTDSYSSLSCTKCARVMVCPTGSVADSRLAIRYEMLF